MYHARSSHVPLMPRHLTDVIKVELSEVIRIGEITQELEKDGSEACV